MSAVLVLIILSIVLVPLLVVGLHVAGIIKISPLSKLLKDSGSGGNGGSGDDGGGSGGGGGGGGSGNDFAPDAAKPGGSIGASGTVFGKMVMTNFSYENNTPCNSMSSASGRPLTPYVSVAVQFRFLKEEGGGPLKLGDYLFVQFLKDRKMPNGTKHTGWVRIDTFCGDLGDDSYCSQDIGGAKYPVIDLYIGSFPKSGQTCDGKGGVSGPGGSGQELTEVSFGPPPAGAFKTNYGGKAKGTGACNDCVSACVIQTGLTRQQCESEVKKGQGRSATGLFMDKCWWYTAQYDNEAKSWCTAENSVGTPASNGGV